MLRIAVRQFIMNSIHPSILAFKKEYVENVALAVGETWEGYWGRMVQDETWVDYMFIQATCWYLTKDMMIVDTGCTVENPWMLISGNLDDDNERCEEMLLIGSKSNSHFQSLLLADNDDNRQKSITMSVVEREDQLMRQEKEKQDKVKDSKKEILEADNKKMKIKSSRKETTKKHQTVPTQEKLKQEKETTKQCQPAQTNEDELRQASPQPSSLIGNEGVSQSSAAN